MPTFKTYEISTLQQLLNVINDDNAENIATDFALWIISYNLHISEFRKQYPELAKGKTNTEIADCEFIWKDDGENGLTGSRVKCNETGEVTEVNYNKNPKQ
jgi:hypothetical protein